MTCADFQELVALYALDALEPADRAAADAHLAEAGAQPAGGGERAARADHVAGADHANCLAALDRARAAASALARGLEPVRPPAGLWERIEAQLQLRSLARAGRTRSARLREPLAWAVAAAALIAVLLLQGGRMRDRAAAEEREQKLAQARSTSESAAETCRRDLSAMRGNLEAQKTALALLQSPSARLVPLGPVPNAPLQAHASVLIDAQQKRGVIVSSAAQLAAPKAGVYQLWLIRGKAAPIPAGLLAPSAEGLLADIAPALLDPGAPDAVAISLEPGPGQSSAPTTLLALGHYPKS